MSSREQALGAAARRPAAEGDGASLHDDLLWERLAGADSTESFVGAWLDLVCRMLGGVRRATVVLGEPDTGPFRPAGWWPVDARPSDALREIADAAMAERRGTVGRAADADVLAWPLLVDEQLCGVAAVELDARGPDLLRAATRQLQWGCGWLDALVRRGSFATKKRLVTVLDLLAVTLEHPRFRAAATAFVTELATALSCEWVAVGLREGGHTEVRALSHSAEFGARTNLIRAIGAAMDEAVDQHAALVHPEPEEAMPRASRAHAELAGRPGVGAVCTVPMVEGDRILGALTLVRGEGAAFEPPEVDLCRHLGALAGPVLAAKARDERWIGRKVRDALSEQVASLAGPENLASKLWTTGLALLVLAMLVVHAEHRVSADAALEGTIQRVVAAPMSGFVAEAGARAGDLVDAGAMLAVLDDRDLQLERLRWVNQREQRQREYSRALAEHDSAQVRILGAQVRQAEAQLALLDEQLARTRILAPFDGIVVSGDLSQSLDAPVERGQALFEVAPLDSYRVVLEVDERDVGQLQVGQPGALALSGLPGRALAMTVSAITPVSSAEEGRNYFRVEASLDEHSELLRPGMEGVGKVDVGERRLGWIWTHKLVHWLRLQLWSLL